MSKKQPRPKDYCYTCDEEAFTLFEVWLPHEGTPSLGDLQGVCGECLDRINKSNRMAAKWPKVQQ